METLKGVLGIREQEDQTPPSPATSLNSDFVHISEDESDISGRGNISHGLDAQEASSFEETLLSLVDQAHARKVLSLLFAVRRPLKVAELRLVYALTTSPQDDNDLGPVGSVEDGNEEAFKELVRTEFAGLITFVKSTANIDDNVRTFLWACSESNHIEGSWKQSITTANANEICAQVCLDVLSLDVDEDAVKQIISEDPSSKFRNNVQKYISSRPLFQYAACNWYEHVRAAGKGFQAHIHKYNALFNVSTPRSWAWMMVAAEQVCLSRRVQGRDWRDEKAVASIWKEIDSYGSRDMGWFVREACLKKLAPLDEKLDALFFDQESCASDTTDRATGLWWTAEDGFRLIDMFHLAIGDWKHASITKAIQALENGHDSTFNLLSSESDRSSLIWIAIQDGAPTALTKLLALTDNLDWLSDTLLYKGEQSGIVARATKTYLEDQKKYVSRHGNWTDRFPATFHLLSEANVLPCASKIFITLGDWLAGIVGPDNEYAQQLWNAGGFVNPILCRKLVESGARVDTVLWQDQLNALHIAAIVWEHDTILELLRLGADPMDVSDNGWSALEWICAAKGEPLLSKNRKIFPQRSKKAKIISSLRAIIEATPQQDALVNQQRLEGITPLMLASQTSPTIVRLLLDYGAEVNLTDSKGRTALIHFFEGKKWCERRTSILAALLKYGANPLEADNEGTHCLGHWAQQLLSQRLDYLASTGSVAYNACNSSFHALDTIGTLPSSHCMAESLKPLKIPLSVAACLSNAKLCLYLLELGADPNEHGVIYANPPSKRRSSREDDLLDLGHNPLLIALSRDAYTTATLLLRFGANVRFQAPGGDPSKEYRAKQAGTTALHYAVTNDVNHMTKPWFMPDPEIPTNFPDDCCFQLVGHSELPVPEHSNRQMLEMLSARSREVGQIIRKEKELSRETSDGEDETIRNCSFGGGLLPYDKLDLESAPRWLHEGDPALEALLSGGPRTEHRQRTFVELLLRLGADTNAQTNEGITPLMICASEGHTELAKMLLNDGAAVNLASTNGVTPLMLAAYRGDLPMAKLLLDHGANPNSQMTLAPETCSCKIFVGRTGSRRWICQAPLTALVFAVAYRYFSVVELLLDHGADPNLTIVHHAHGRLETRKEERRRIRRQWKPRDSSDEDSEPDVERWTGYVSTATALTWARKEIRELLLRQGADAAVEKPIQECGCRVEPQSKESMATFG